MRLNLFSLALLAFIFSPLNCFSQADTPGGVSLSLKEKVSEAHDYLRVKPQLALKMFQDLEGELQNADEKLQLDAYISALWAGVYLSDPQITQYYNDKIVHFINLPDEDQRYNRILKAVAGHLWRQKDHRHAYLFAACSLDYAQTPARKMSSLSLMGASARQTRGEYAQKVYLTGLAMAQQSDSPRYLAAFNNNLGVVALNNYEFEKAEEFFKTALDIRHRINHMSGQVTSGVNLMLTYFMAQKWDYFMRLSQRMEIKLKNHSSAMYRNYYKWLLEARRVMQEAYITEDDKQYLTQIYIDIDQPGVQSIIRKAAIALDVYLPEVEEPEYLEGANMLALFPMCDWQKYQTLSTDDLLQEF